MVSDAVTYMNKLNSELGIDVNEANECDCLLAYGISKINERVLNFIELD